MDIHKKKKLERLLIYGLVLAIVFCCVLLLPQVRKLIILIGEKVLGRGLNHEHWMKRMTMYSLYAMCCFGILSYFIILILPASRKKYFLKYGKRIFVIVSIGIIVMSIIVRIIMYIKCRSLWLDEAMLAFNIVSRNWFELLIPPLGYSQSAPVIYIIIEKLIGSIFGYSEFSLRLFSLFSFLGLLICEIMLLRKAFNFDNFRIAFVVAMTALLPLYIWYSNELKPYMSDTFFVVLIILIYLFYKQNKIKLPALTALYILFLGLSTPSIFFIAGMLFSEFLIAIFNKNRKQIFYIIISGMVVLTVFGLYYYWWMLPVSEAMKNYWGIPHVRQLQEIFYSGVGHSNSSFIKYLLPFAILGIFSLIKIKSKIAFSILLSLFFTFLASSIGKWPLIGRLWLFLPVIILFFTPSGICFIRTKIHNKIDIDIIEFFLFSIMITFFSVNCLKYTGDKMYWEAQEVNSLILFIQENIKEEEKLYVYPTTKPVFDFKNGYNSTKIGNVMKDNIIYGKNRDEWNQSYVGNELLSILENKKTYLLFQDRNFKGIDKGLAILQNYGTLTEVMNVHDTPLYYFELDESKDREY